MKPELKWLSCNLPHRQPDLLGDVGRYEAWPCEMKHGVAAIAEVVMPLDGRHASQDDLVGHAKVEEGEAGRERWMN